MKGGSGIEILPPGGGDTSVEILQVERDGMAAQAGMQRGDQSVAVNGQKAAEMDEDGPVQAPRARKLALGILRAEGKWRFKRTLDSE